MNREPTQYDKEFVVNTLIEEADKQYKGLLLDHALEIAEHFKACQCDEDEPSLKIPMVLTISSGAQPFKMVTRMSLTQKTTFSSVEKEIGKGAQKDLFDNSPEPEPVSTKPEKKKAPATPKKTPAKKKAPAKPKK